MSILNFQQMGEGSDVILIHGLFGSLENLNMVSKALANDFRVTQVDVRNHGLSFHEHNMEYTNLAQDIIHVMEHLNIKKAMVLGHSMGGKIAMQLALKHPEYVTKLIVADIAPVNYPPHHKSIMTGLKAIDLTKVHKRKDADDQLAAYVDNIGVRQFLLRNLATKDNEFYFKCDLDAIEACYPQIMKGYEGDEQFDGPTLFIKGELSDYVQAQHRETIINLFPNSRAKVIQGAGHWLHAEKTTAFNKIVHNFFKE